MSRSVLVNAQYSSVVHTQALQSYELLIELCTARIGASAVRNAPDGVLAVQPVPKGAGKKKGMKNLPLWQAQKSGVNEEQAGRALNHNIFATAEKLLSASEHGAVDEEDAVRIFWGRHGLVIV